MRLRKLCGVFFISGIAVLPFNFLLGFRVSSVTVTLPTVLLYFAAALHLLDISLSAKNNNISTYKFMFILWVLVTSILPVFIVDDYPRFFLVSWAYIALFLNVSFFIRTSAQFKLKLYNYVFAFLVLGVGLDILDEYFDLLSSLLGHIDQTGSYTINNRIRAFFDEASVLASFCFSLILLNGHINGYSFLSRSVFLVIFIMLLTMSSLVVIYLFCIFCLYRVRMRHLLLFPLFFSIAIVIFGFEFFYYTFYWKILSYLSIGSNVGIDSGSIRGAYLFYTLGVIVDNPLGIGFGQSVGIGRDLVLYYGAPESLLAVLGEDSALLNGWLQLFVEAGLLSVVPTVVYAIFHLFRLHRKNFLVIGFTFFVAFLVLAPIYSVAFTLLFCMFFTPKRAFN